MTRETPDQSQGGGQSAASLRINKALADAGVCSRRAADALVAAGRVCVNGRVLDSAGARIDPARDVVTVDGRAVSVPVPGAREHLYVLLNKPVGVVTTASDPEGRRTVLDVLGPQFPGARLFPVGRLDFFSQGLILLTDDGALAHRMAHPSHHLPKVYHVAVRGDVPRATLDAFAGGMTLAEGETLAPVPTRVLRAAAGATSLEMTLIQGLNRQIRRMCRDAGLTVLRLERVSQGPLELGGLPEGQARELSGAEVAALFAAVGLSAPEAPSPAAKPGPKPSAKPGPKPGAKPAPAAPRGDRPPRPQGAKKAPGANRGRKKS